jgi:hypothetical protein
MGSYFELDAVLRADARVVEVETGRVVQSVGASSRPNDFLSLEQRLASDLSGYLLTVNRKTSPPEGVARRSPIKAPAGLKLSTALRYALGLVAMDRGDKAAATAGFQAVLQEQPDFTLAKADLDHLIR